MVSVDGFVALPFEIGVPLSGFVLGGGGVTQIFFNDKSPVEVY